ncbi:hypothetical protein [Pararhizobium sp. IMCC21322]|uniref:hypothetical protein n=1 Tax=Pararhizobium sp. IMCC21322 TaxID=3067903 RepID=UPI00274094E6|nr:hypothetical protein [Pararhizobium sp. IMCC21322]
MDSKIVRLRTEIAELQDKLRVLENSGEAPQTSEQDLDRMFFDDATVAQHTAQRSPTIPYILNLPIGAHLSAPFVYGMVFPIAFLDICLFIYQAVCFRLWKVARVRRGDYVVIDRHHLAYLNGIEKLNCVYCGYANGMFAFAQEIAARTEQFWCPIKHASQIAQPHSHYSDFTEFGDAEAWQEHPSRKKPKA